MLYWDGWHLDLATWIFCHLTDEYPDRCLRVWTLRLHKQTFSMPGPFINAIIPLINAEFGDGVHSSDGKVMVIRDHQPSPTFSW
jgi:hypothetical protein